MYKTLELDIKDRVATIWLNRPDVHNAFNEDLIEELTTCLSSLGIKEGIRAIVLAGRGKSFSAGADLNWMKRVANYTREQNLDDARALAEMLRTLNFISKPTIARVHGAALGGGLGLVACCDIAVASTSATFATSEARLGLIPATIGPYVVAAIVSAPRGDIFSPRNGSTQKKPIESGWCTRYARMTSSIAILMTCWPSFSAVAPRPRPQGKI